MSAQKRNTAEWSSPVARRAHNPKAAGSNPASATSNLYGICHTGFFLYLCGFTGFQTAVKQRTFCVKMKGFLKLQIVSLQFRCSRYCKISQKGPQTEGFWEGRKSLIRWIAFLFSSSKTWEYRSVVAMEECPNRF